jgi:Holliday junction resolvase
MANPNGRKGSKFETDVLKWLRQTKGVLAERLTKAGAKDEGDLVVIISGKTFIFELKNRATLSLPEFWREAQVEALNYARARGIGEVPLHYVIVKRRNASIENAWVIQDLSQWLKEKQVPTPEGIISTSTGPVDQAPTTEVVEDDGVVETEPEVQE